MHTHAFPSVCFQLSGSEIPTKDETLSVKTRVVSNGMIEFS